MTQRPPAPRLTIALLALLLVTAVGGACGSSSVPDASGPAISDAPHPAGAAVDAGGRVATSPARPATESRLTARATPAPGARTSDAPSPVSGMRPGKQLTREVFGFLNWFTLPAIEGRIQYDALTTIAFFSIDVDLDGRLVRGTKARPTGAWAAWMSDRMTTLISEAHAADTHVVLSVSRFAWDRAGTRDTVALLSRPAARQRLAAGLAAAIAERDVDGVNIDLEPVPTGQRANFTHLLREVRRAMDATRPGLGLTFDSTGFSTEYDVPALIAPDAADAIYIMGYQYRGPWSRYAGDVAPLVGPGFGIRQTVDDFLAGTSPDGIILGLPWYGWQWQTETNALHGRTIPADDRNGRSRPVYYEEAAALAQQMGSEYDAEEGSARVMYQARACRTCPRLWRQIYFDDTRALAQKYAYVNERGLRGVGVWALGFEGSRSDELYEVIRDAFGTARR